MATKPKAGGAKKRLAKAALLAKKAKEKTQRARFIETARAVGVDETGNEFERALAKIIIPKKS